MLKSRIIVGALLTSFILQSGFGVTARAEIREVFDSYGYRQLIARAYNDALFKDNYWSPSKSARLEVTDADINCVSELMKEVQYYRHITLNKCSDMFGKAVATAAVVVTGGALGGTISFASVMGAITVNQQFEHGNLEMQFLDEWMGAAKKDIVPLALGVSVSVVGYLGMTYIVYSILKGSAADSSIVDLSPEDAAEMYTRLAAAREALVQVRVNIDAESDAEVAQ